MNIAGCIVMIIPEFPRLQIWREISRIPISRIWIKTTRLKTNSRVPCWSFACY